MKTQTSDTQDWQRPFLSIIVPTFREENTINSFLDALFVLDKPAPYEIILVDSTPSQATCRAVKDHDVLKLGSLKGRAVQMNVGARAARADALLFLHADTRLPENGLFLIHETLGNEAIQGGAFSLHLRSRHPFVRLTQFMTNLRARATRIPFGDQGIFLRRDFFFNLGGFPEIPLMEDLELMLRIRKQNAPIRILREQVSTSARRWRKEGPFLCTFRNMLFRALYRFGVSPSFLAKWYK